MDSAAQSWLARSPRATEIPIDGLLGDEPTISRALGYGSVAVPALPAGVRSSVQRMRTPALDMLAPQVCWRPWAIVAVADTEDALTTAAGPLSIGDIVWDQLRGCGVLVVFALTIGDALEREARRMMAAGEPLDGFVLDALGSVAVDAVADRFCADLLAEVRRFGWQTTNRFSPGYCTWPTADQQALFALLPDAPAGVHLSASHLMHPMKSISGVVGVGPLATVHPYPCAFCSQPDCPQRLVESRLGSSET
jgi:hypothetical protein